MDKNSDNPQLSPCQSVPGQKLIDKNLVSSSSPLFYTVSSSQSENPPYYEQLGCPSILKPNFRDLTGSTRLSLGVPSTRRFPLLINKLNKTIMGKSQNLHSKRFAQEDKFISPIKVNAKIRHIYSHISTTSASAHSNKNTEINSASTQTENDAFDDQSNYNLNELASNKNLETKNAFTCMSPPPPEKSTPLFGTASFPMEDCFFTVPSSSSGKLEDLEQITGHIVIRRFFTRADEALGSWTEKKLNLNQKSADISDSSFNSNFPNNFDSLLQGRGSGILENIIEVDDTIQGDEENNFYSEIKKCDKTDLVPCECFLDHYFQQQNHLDLNLDLEKENLTNDIAELTAIDKDLISQCTEYEINSKPVGQFSSSQNENKETLEINAYEENSQDKAKVKQDSEIQDATENEIEINDNTNKLKINDNPSQNIKSPEEENNTAEVKEEIFQSSSSAVLSDGNNDGERPCIPDVIDVSVLPKSMEFSDYDANIISIPGKFRSITGNDLESDTKVAEYLVKLKDESNDSIDIFPEEYVSQSQLDRSIESPNILHKPTGSESPHENPHQSLKRSISNDSCIGTESSGEAKGILHDSGLGLSSSRVQIDEEESESRLNTIESTTEKEWFFNEDDPDQITQTENQGQKVVAVISRKRTEEDSISRSERSSANKHISDGDDADQSESESENSSIRTPASVMSVVSEDLQLHQAVEDEVFVNKDEEQSNEPDQFDFIIANHEKLKRIRPVCRKRNISTQTSKSIESSIVSTSASSRSTTATTSSDSAFDLEFVSKSKKYITCGRSGENTLENGKRKSELGKNSLNVLNMKFTLGREFESQVSIRIPQQSPNNNNNNANTAISSTKPNSPSYFPKVEGITESRIGRESHTRKSLTQSAVCAMEQQSQELSNLWKDVKSKMESRVGGESSPTSFDQNELHVLGSRMRLISVADEPLPSTGRNTATSSNVVHNDVSLANYSSDYEGRIKRSLKRLQKILDDPR